MKTKVKGIRCLVILLACLILVLSLAACGNRNANRTTQNNRLSFTQNRSGFSIETFDEENTVERKGYSDGDIVNAIVLVNEKSLAESCLERKNTCSLSEYAKSAEGQTLVEAMLSEQDTVIDNLCKSETECKIKQRYTTLFNGFCIQVRYGSTERIRRMEGVSEVLICETFEIPTTYQTEVFVNAVTGMLKNKSSYQGEGMVAAVIDSGLDYTHSAFMTMPECGEMLKCDISDISEYLMANYGYGNDFGGEDLYMNPKIVYAFDYADNDTDVKVAVEDSMGLMKMDSSSLYHGTHVAGILVGNDEVIRAAAPEAQLAFMKVASDKTGSMAMNDILAAVSDACMLGVDVINMSLGSDCGPVEYVNPAYDIVNRVYAVTEKLGIALCVSAGNASFAPNSYGATRQHSSASAPDNGVIGFPSSSPAALSVGSSMHISAPVVVLNGERVPVYNVGFEEGGVQWHSDILSKLDGMFDYELVPEYGSLESDYEGLNLRGKIAVVNNEKNVNETEINKKVELVKNAGAVGVIFFFSEGSIKNIILDTDYPAAVLPSEFIDRITENPVGKIVFNKKDAIYNMSEFSSWGPTSDLDIGIDISAPGSDIWSSMPTAYVDIGGQPYPYAYLSGTSMASPNVSSAYIVVSQYVKEKYPELTNRERVELVNRLIMSTAEEMVKLDGTPFSPRHQGAGVVNIENAVKTKAYLSVIGSNRVKLNLGSDIQKEGIYTLSFNLVNTSDSSLRYRIDVKAITEQILDGCMMNNSYALRGTEFRITVKNGSLDGDVVTVDGKETAKIKVVVVLSEEDKAYMNENFANGIYVEGFVKLYALEDGIDLSIPYIAFFGDWDRVPLVEENGIEMSLRSLNPNGNYGKFPIHPRNVEKGFEIPEVDNEHMALGNGFLVYSDEQSVKNIGFDSIVLRLRRNVEYMTLSLVDPENDTLFFAMQGYDLRKAPYNPSISLVDISVLGDNMLMANNQTMVFKVRIYQNLKKDIYTEEEFPIFIDMDAPTLIDAAYREENGRKYLDFELFDNHFLCYMRVFDGNMKKQKALSKRIPIYNAQKNTVNNVTLDITDYYESRTNDTLTIRFCDYAGNPIEYDFRFGESEETVNSNNRYQDSVQNIAKNDQYAVMTSTMKFSAGNVKPLSEDEPEFVVEDGVLKKYNGKGGEVVIPDDVSVIAENVFYGNKTITKLILSEGVTEISKNAFAFCSELTEIVFNGNLKKIGEASFAMTQKLEKVNFEALEKIESIGPKAFLAAGLKELTIPENFGSITLEYLSFSLMQKLQRLTINAPIKLQGTFIYLPELLTVDFNEQISSDFSWSNPFAQKLDFIALDKLITVNVNVDVKEFGLNNTSDSVASMFVSCPALREVNFYGEVEKFGSKPHSFYVESIFSDCAALESVVFHKKLGMVQQKIAPASLSAKFVVPETNSFNTVDESGVLYDKDKTWMIMPPAWDYEGTFVVPESVCKLTDAQFSDGLYAKAEYTCSVTEEEYSVSVKLNYELPDREIHLTGVKLNDNITVIPKYCFMNCTGLKSMDSIDWNGAKINYYGENAFYNSIRNLVFPDDGDEIYVAGYFDGDANLESVVFPRKTKFATSWEDVREPSFAECINLKYVDYPLNYDVIGRDNFKNCYNLEKIRFNGIIISSGSFVNCYNLKEIEDWGDLDKRYISPTRTVPGYGMFDNPYVLEMGSFSDCYALESFKLPGTIMSRYGYDSMEYLVNCTSLRTIEIGRDFEGVGYYFKGNIGLKEFSIDRLFPGCPIEDFIIEEGNAYYSSIDGSIYNADGSELLYYSPYKKAEELILPESCLSIASESETLRLSWENIAKQGKNYRGVFEDNTSLKKVTALSVTSIGAYAFRNSVIEKIEMPLLDVIGVAAFENCTRLVSFDLMNNLHEIDENAFRNSGLREVNLNNAAYVFSYAFRGCSQLERVTLGNCEGFNFAQAFYQCDNIEEIVLTDECRAFVMTDGILYNAEQTILYRSIRDKNAEKYDLIIPDDVKIVSQEAFKNDNSLRSVTFGKGVGVIGEKAFWGCENIEKLVFTAEKAPVLQSRYEKGRRYSYDQFIRSISDEQLDIEIVIPEDASYRTFIWQLYFGITN